MWLFWFANNNNKRTAPPLVTSFPDSDLSTDLPPFRFYIAPQLLSDAKQNESRPKRARRAEDVGGRSPLPAHFRRSQ